MCIRDRAKAALAIALHVQLRLLAPFLPYVTEEVWSWWQDGSIHRASWPDPAVDVTSATQDPGVLDEAARVLAVIRGAKSAAKVSMRTEVARATVRGPSQALHLARQVTGDIGAAGHVTGTLAFEEDESLTGITVDVDIAG